MYSQVRLDDLLGAVANVARAAEKVLVRLDRMLAQYEERLKAKP